MQHERMAVSHKLLMAWLAAQFSLGHFLVNQRFALTIANTFNLASLFFQVYQVG